MRQAITLILINYDHLTSTPYRTQQPMSLTKNQISELSNAFIQAQKSVTPITNPIDQYPNMTIAEAYSIQQTTYQTRIKNGDTVVGGKIGLSSKIMQEVFNTDQPIYGSLFSSMVALEGEPISIGSMIRPLIEGETAFVLDTDLKGPGATVGKAMASIAGIIPAFEIADSRSKEKPKAAQDLIADSSLASKVILGGQITPIDEIDLRHIGVVLEQDGEVIATGATAAVLGNPIHSLVNLVNKLAEYDIGLSAGDFVIPGTPHPAVPAVAGSCYRATFDHFGYVKVRFTD